MLVYSITVNLESLIRRVGPKLAKAVFKISFNIPDYSFEEPYSFPDRVIAYARVGVSSVC